MTRSFRFIPVLLTLCLLFVLISCASEEAPESYDKSFDADIETVFNGETLQYVGATRDGRMEINPYYNENEDSFWNDKLRQRYEEVEKKYNINIEFTTNNGLLKENYIAGLGWADIFEEWASTLDDYINGGFMYSLNYFDGFLDNLDSGMWGTENSLRYLKRGEDYYGFQSYFHFVPFRHLCGILYGNKTCLDRYGVSPFAMIEEGKWTWEGFEDVIKLIGNNYEDPEADIGFLISSSFPHYFTYSAIMSNGGETVTFDEDGRVWNNMGDDKVTEAIQWVTDLIKDNVVSYGDNSGYTPSKSAAYQFPRFSEGKCAFWCEYSYVGTVDVSGFMFYDVDFYILPCPCGPQGTYGDWKGFIAGADHYFSVPLTANEDIVNAVLVDIYSPLGEDKFSWKEQFAKSNFLYDESAYMYYTMVENAVPVFEDATNVFPFGTVISGKKGLAEALESSNEKIQSVLDSAINQFIK